jgi:uncharacterized OB-fold protein
VSVILPDVEDPVSAPFWEGTAAGELRYQTCAECGRFRHPPRPMCPHCQSLESTWVVAGGRGTIWSFVVAHPPLLPAWADQAPYPVAVITLDEDPTLRMVGNVVRTADGPLGELGPDDLAIGTCVQVVFPEPVDGVVLPRWQPV